MTSYRAYGMPLLPVAVVLALPFALRPSGEAGADDSETLIVLTPHNEAIRSEIGAGFRQYMQRVGRRKVTVDWRTPGGTSEISRYLVAQYGAAFRRDWTERLSRPWTLKIAAAFANPALAPVGGSPPSDEQQARTAFLSSSVSSGADILFGGGSSEFISHAAAGRLVDAGVVAEHPDLFNPAAIPQTLGGEPYWDAQGRWVGTCLSGFGICYNRDSVARLGLPVPTTWEDLAAPGYAAQLALADPTKSGSAIKAFEMVIQQEMQQAVLTETADGAAQPAWEAQRRAVRAGWDKAMRLIRRMAANARYFTDSASKVPMDIAAGDAAAGMCIDFYGRFQAETISPAARSRLQYVTPRGGSSIGADPVAMLRGAPHAALAKDFMAFLLSEDGQKLWDYRVGTPGGPMHRALRRLPILPLLYDAEHLRYASDPDARPFEDARAFHYRAEWTAPLLRAIAFVIRVMCVEPQDELASAYRALSANGHPPRAVALFDDTALVDYEQVSTRVRPILAAGDPVGEITLANQMTTAFRQQYQRVIALAVAKQ